MEKKKVIVLVIWLAFAGIMCGIYFGGYHEERAQVPVKTEIEQAIGVGGLENKFVFARSVFFGGAGGGGLGAPMVICSSAEQFVGLVPKDEPIYVAFEFPVVEEEEGITTNSYIKKVYWAFIENRAGLMVYEDVYSYDGYWVEKYTPEMVYFYYNNLEVIMAILVLVGILTGLAAGFGSVKVAQSF